MGVALSQEIGRRNPDSAAFAKETIGKRVPGVFILGKLCYTSG